MTIGASDPEHRRSSNLRCERGSPDDFPPVRPACQRSADAHDRRHERARLQREHAQQLHSRRAGVRGLHRPLARHGNGGGFAPLPAAPDAEWRTAAEHQQRGLGPALLFHRDARPARPCPAAHGRAPAAAAADCTEHGGDYASAAGSAGVEAQGSIRYRRSLSSGRPKAGPVGRRAARFRGSRAQGRRYRL